MWRMHVDPSYRNLFSTRFSLGGHTLEKIAGGKTPLSADSMRKGRAATDPSVAGGFLQLSGRQLLPAMAGVMTAMFLAAVSQIN